MEIIPLIKIRKNRIINEIDDIDTYLEKIKPKKLYILDLDGIERNKPNLCTFQRLSKIYDIWVDNGPRNLGDIVDILMSGAEKITITSDLYDDLHIEQIRYITENMIYEKIDISEKDEKSIVFSSKSFDGFVNLNNRSELEKDFFSKEIIKKHIQKKPIYVYENDSKNIEYWKKIGDINFLVDLERFQGFI